MEMVEQSRCNIVKDYDFIFVLTRFVNVAITNSDEQTFWSKRCMSDIMSHFVIKVSGLVRKAPFQSLDCVRLTYTCH